MPRYDYKCTGCNEKFEQDVPQAQTVIVHTCGSIAYRLPSAPAFTIKGYSEKNGYSNE